MNSDGQFQPLARIVAALLSLYQERQSGSFFLSTDQNHMGTVALQTGNIIALQYRNKRGESAIPFFNQIESASFKFEKDFQMIKAQSDLPTTTSILQQLGANVPSEIGEETSPSTEAVATSNSDVASLMSEAQQQIIEQTMAKFVGPLAGMICGNVFQQTTELSTVLTMLSEQMPDSILAEQFMQEVKANLEAG